MKNEVQRVNAGLLVRVNGNGVYVTPEPTTLVPGTRLLAPDGSALLLYQGDEPVVVGYYLGRNTAERCRKCIYKNPALLFEGQRACVRFTNWEANVVQGNKAKGNTWRPAGVCL